jgi:hypothetical protein
MTILLYYLTILPPSQGQLQWLDSNPRPWNDECSATVLGGNAKRTCLEGSISSFFDIKCLWVEVIDIKRKNRLLKVCYVPTTSTPFGPFSLFLLQPLTVLMRQTRQAVCAINQSIFLRCLWSRYITQITSTYSKCSLDICV